MSAVGSGPMRMLLGIIVLQVAAAGLTRSQTAPPTLPPPRVALEKEPSLSPELKVYIREFRFHGNTVFTDGDLWQVVADYVRREVTSDDLEQARRALSLHYIQHGYLNSGALLEDQVVTNGVVHFRIVEGELSGIDLEGNQRLRSNWLRRRLHYQAGSPLNLNSLQTGLLQLRDNPNLKRLNAALHPGPISGTSQLSLKVEEAFPWHLALQARNDRPPSVGAEALEILSSYANLSGHSDELALRYGLFHRTEDGMAFSGHDDWGLSYALPFTARDTTIAAYFDTTDYAIIQEPFLDLDVTSQSTSFGLTLRQPLYRDARQEFVAGLTLERRESETFLFGEPFSLTPGAVDGRSVVAPLRFFQEYLVRSQKEVLALRSTLSWGLDMFAATSRSTEPNALFLAWLGQAQYLRRLGNSQTELVLNTILQWADDPLLSLEQFSLGGASTVRGYHENQIVRDMGWVGSAELRVPVSFSRTGSPTLQLATFFDYGRAWNARGSTPDPPDLASAGLGLIFAPHKKVYGRIYWGYAFRHFEEESDHVLQDYGIYFRLRVNLF